jgi:ATP-dependent Clp protease ATP-binding subunit ClpB
LDDGRLTDNKGRVVNFKNTIIVMTSNVGSAIIQSNLQHMNEKNRSEVLEKTKDEVFELLKQTMRPEFLNRVDELIMFTPLTKAEIREIVKLQFNQVIRKLGDLNIEISITDGATDRIGELGYDPQYGARPIKRLIQRNILNELSRKILEGTVKRNSALLIDCENDEIVFKNR